MVSEAQTYQVEGGQGFVYEDDLENLIIWISELFKKFPDLCKNFQGSIEGSTGGPARRERGKVMVYYRKTLDSEPILMNGGDILEFVEGRLIHHVS